MSIGKLTSNKMNEMFDDVDKLVTQQLIPQTQSEECLKIAKLADLLIAQISDAYKEKPFDISKINISMASKLVFDLYTSKMKLFNKENVKEYAEVAKSVEKCLSNTLAVFYPKANTEMIKVGEVIFETMVQSILTNVEEEVVGQERMPGAMLRIVEKAIPFEVDIEGLEKIRKTAALLYPLALLAASFDPRAKIPLVEVQEELLKHDMNQFDNEYKCQFRRHCSDLWSPEKFAECLKYVWEARRKES